MGSERRNVLNKPTDFEDDLSLEFISDASAMHLPMGNTAFYWQSHSPVPSPSPPIRSIRFPRSCPPIIVPSLEDREGRRELTWTRSLPGCFIFVTVVPSHKVPKMWGLPSRTDGKTEAQRKLQTMGYKSTKTRLWPCKPVFIL